MSKKIPIRLLPSSFGKGRRRGLAPLAAIVALALTNCGSRNTFVAPPPPKVVVAQPVQEPLTLYLYLTGNTAPFRTTNLVARVQGYLESIDYQDGAAVKKGTQLFGIERDVYQAQLDLAKAQLAKDQAVLGEAQVDLTRYQTLAKQQSIALQQAQDQEFVVEQDKATVGVDQANVDTANINLGYTRVLAPFDGIVTNHQVDIGNLVGDEHDARNYRPDRSTLCQFHAKRAAIFGDPQTQCQSWTPDQFGRSDVSCDHPGRDRPAG
jgi:membrane fusion protein, multidrug efflux system